MNEMQVTLERRFAVAASRDRLERSAEALRAHGIEALVVDDRESARRAVLDRIPKGAQVHQGASLTLEQTGLTEAIEQSGDYAPVRPQAWAMDREAQADEIRRLTTVPDFMLGSVHAVTEDGSLVAASATGSQLAPYSAGAGKVILVVGAQKVVPNLDTAFERIREHAFRLEDERAQQAYGIHSAINQLLIVNGDWLGRITVVLVDEALGF